MDKSQIASKSHLNATLRWVDLTVALVMVHKGMQLERGLRSTLVEDRLNRWRGNRTLEWKPTAYDIDQLVEATTRWAFDEMEMPVFEAADEPSVPGMLPGEANE